VGGDFFQVVTETADGSTLLVIGDVGGKGMHAGMLAALIIGAVRTAAEFTTDPARILNILNERLQNRGVATCLALRIDDDGHVTSASAGHIPPYLNGDEVSMEGTLPLGITPGIEYPTERWRLENGDALVLITDGVIEAQNIAGDLFGFDRVRDLVLRHATAASLAAAAKQFGQQDDITVLSIESQRAANKSEHTIAQPTTA
jgi:serine phosphatase RsbU (regulator of sigma subunit)